MLLSIIIPGKNDDYIYAIDRLGLNLNKTLSNINNHHKGDIEVVLCDWGSEIKITEKFNLTTSKNFTCVYVPSDIAFKYNRGANYSIVHPINTAFRRSKGKYAIWWDSDCYVKTEDFIKLYEFVKVMDETDDKKFYQGPRRHIPPEVFLGVKDYSIIDSFLEANSSDSLVKDFVDDNNFLGCCISMLMNRELWEKSTGWWEELTYWGWQDIEFHRRLMTKYNYGGSLDKKGINFHHFNHHPFTPPQKFSNPPHVAAYRFEANDENWGLVNENLIVY